MSQNTSNNLLITNNLQSAHGAFIDTLCHLGNEIVSDTISNLLSDVIALDQDKIINLFDLPKDENLDALEDDIEFLTLLFDNQILGFLASVNIPVKNRIAFDTDGKVTSFSYSGGHLYVDYAYAETMYELTQKIINLSEHYLQIDIEKARNTIG